MEDIGELAPDGGWEETSLPGAGAAPERTERPRSYKAVPDAPGAPEADPGPAHATKQFRKRARGTASSRPARVTVPVRTDIAAKIEFALTVPGAVWQARDPLCGGVFIGQVPATAAALTNIVCESPDLIAFFTGPGGAFMRWLEVGAALMPVVQVVAAHHVYHSIGIEPGDPTQPGYQANNYAA